MKTVNVDKDGGIVYAMVKDQDYPQSITGIIWRYDTNKQPDGKAGSFNSSIGTLPLGTPSECDKNFFLVDGIVIHQNDDPPTPYQITVAILQDEKELLKMVAEDNGTGQLGKDNIQFTQRLKIIQK